MSDEREAPVLRIDLRSPTPVFRQISDSLRALLVSGGFKPGDRLPTVRQLAIDLAVHHNTVAQAYRLLAEEGWLELRRGHGVTVMDRRPQQPTSVTQQNFLQHLRELTARAVADGLDAEGIAQQLDALANELNKQTEK